MRSTRLLYASRVALIVLAIVSAHFALRQLWIMWGHCGTWGFYMDLATAKVSGFEPTIAPKDVHLGDQIDLAAMPFRERSYLYEALWRPPGFPLAVKITNAKSTRILHLKTARLDAANDESVAVFVMKIVALIYILVAVVLVWSRPSPMPWGLALFMLGTDNYWVADLNSPMLATLVLSSYAILTALAWVGLIVFTARFPDNRPTASTNYWYLIAAACFFYDIFLAIHDYVPLFTARPISDLPDWMSNGVKAVLGLTIFGALCWKMLRSKARSQLRGFGYVVAGYGVSIAFAWNMLPYLLNYFPDSWSYWWCVVAQRVLMLALPASVAYVILRHRAFGLGYLANLTLVYGAYAVGVGSAFVVSVWFVSYLTSSSLGIAIAMFVALLVGMTLRSSRTLVARFVDRMFLRRRYETLTSLDTIRHTLRNSDDPERLTDELATTLGLASLAVFSRAADGGFVRRAAFGWPAGSAWHLLPEETLTRTLDLGGSTIVRVPEDRDNEFALPEHDARPQFALAVRRGDRIERAIFVGPQRNGTNLDRDAMRSLHGVFDDTIFA